MYKVIKYIFIIIFIVFALFPFVWLISTSLKGTEELFSYPPKLLPDKINLENYKNVWQALPFTLYFINSIVIAGSVVLINLLISSMAGFALAKFDFKNKNLYFLLVIAALLIPKELIIIPVYISVLKLGLADSLAGVIIPFAVEGYAIFMMRQAFLSIPTELCEAAIIDGCSPFKLWYKIMLPLSKPTLAVLGLFTFIGTWGDFLWPLIVLKSQEHYTLQVGLSYMLGTFVNNFRFAAAGSVLALMPVILIFLFTQKYFMKGLLSGFGK